MQMEITHKFVIFLTHPIEYQYNVVTNLEMIFIKVTSITLYPKGLKQNEAVALMECIEKSKFHKSCTTNI